MVPAVSSDGGAIPHLDRGIVLRSGRKSLPSPERRHIRVTPGLSSGEQRRPLHAVVRRTSKCWQHPYASLYALSSAATSSFTIVIMASITPCTFLGFVSLMSSMKRLGTICHVTPN